LPDLVAHVNNINIFKERLDKFWQRQNFIFDFAARRYA